MKTQLKALQNSYDQAIEYGRKGIDLYEALPEHITSDPAYPLYEQLKTDDRLSDSDRPEIRDFLAPEENMKFVDLGCCLNLMFNGYNTWPSVYHGVDISGKTIGLLREYSARENLPVGELYCGSIHETPFADHYFDIASCIGVLEYFEKDFIVKALAEAHRIIRPSGKFVLDIPNLESPVCGVMMLIEEHLGRPDLFHLSVSEFEVLLEDLFVIEKTEAVGPMIQYFLRRC